MQLTSCWGALPAAVPLIERALKVCSQVFEVHGRYSDPSEWLKRLSYDGCLFLITIDGRDVAVLISHAQSPTRFIDHKGKTLPPDHTATWHIWICGVLAEYRRRGLMRRLFDLAEARRPLYTTAITVNTIPERFTAMPSFVEERGYVVWKRQTVHDELLKRDVENAMYVRKAVNNNSNNGASAPPATLVTEYTELPDGDTSHPAYWNNLYASEWSNGQREWYVRGDTLLTILNPLLKNSRCVLHVGCGSDPLPCIMLQNGYEGECIAVDFAESLIASMSVKYLHPRLRYLKNDITTSLSLPASSVDIAIDRGLSDSLAASENAKLQLQEMEKNIFITCKSWCLLTHDEKRPLEFPRWIIAEHHLLPPAAEQQKTIYHMFVLHKKDVKLS